MSVHFSLLMPRAGKCMGFICRALLLISCLALPAYAGTIELQATSELKARLENNQVIIEGSYALHNKGNELAKDVYPAMKLGTWQWAGEPQLIHRNESYTWKLEERFPINKLSCEVSESCRGLELPLKGGFTLKILHFYKDQNGYQFSAAAVESLRVGQFEGELRTQLQIPVITAKLEVDGDGERFDGRVTLKNTSHKAHVVLASIHSSRELSVDPEYQQISVPPGEEASRAVDIENFSGRPGSGYAMIAVLEWQQGEIRNTSSAFAVVSLRQPDKTSVYVVIGIAVAALMLLAMYFAVVAPVPEKAKKKLPK